MKNKLSYKPAVGCNSMIFCHHFRILLCFCWPWTTDQALKDQLPIKMIRSGPEAKTCVSENWFGKSEYFEQKTENNGVTNLLLNSAQSNSSQQLYYIFATSFRFNCAFDGQALQTCMSKKLFGISWIVWSEDSRINWVANLLISARANQPRWIFVVTKSVFNRVSFVEQANYRGLPQNSCDNLSWKQSIKRLIHHCKVHPGISVSRVTTQKSASQKLLAGHSLHLISELDKERVSYNLLQ